MYRYSRTGATWDGTAVHRQVFRYLDGIAAGSRILDAGCGNGYLCSLLAERGYECVGVDPSSSGIALARRAYPAASFQCSDMTTESDDLKPGSFDAITCVEVIEHVYAPRLLLANLFRLLRPEGRLIVTTPYHGYLKNLLIALSGKSDRHFNPLWDDGHIKFFSRHTLRHVLRETGYRRVEIQGVGRVTGLWTSMVATAIRPR